MEEALLIYDYETTGPDPKEAKPVQIAATLHRVGQHPLIVMNMLCNPGCEISEGASEVHGIFASQVRSQPHHTIATHMLASYAEGLRETYDLIIGGQNHIAYDNAIARENGWEEIDEYRQLDLLTVARHELPTMHNHKLSTLYLDRVGKSLSGAHNAIVDVIGVGEVLDTFLEEYDNSYLTMSKAFEKPRAWEIMPIGKFKGKPTHLVSKGWMQWMCKNTTIHLENADFAETLKVHFNPLWKTYVENK